MYRIISIVVLTCVATSSASAQELTGNITLTSDYIFRGISQTNEEPAVQGGFDFSRGLFYAGIWGSNIDFGGPGSLEADFYAGFTKEYDGRFSWDVGAIHYSYPGATDLNFTEVYGGLGYRGVAVKLYYSDDFAGTAAEATYLDMSYEQSLSERWQLVVGAGHSAFDDDSLTDYYDYRIGINLEMPHLSIGLMYTDTDLPSDDGLADLGDGRVAFSLSKEM